MSQTQISIRHNALDLMELRQMCRVQWFVTEHTIDGEIFGGRETVLRSTASNCIVREYIKLWLN